MKYVRTEDGHILKVGETTDYGYAAQPDLKFACRFVDLENEVKREFVRIVDKADDIKDLCDAFVNVEIAGGFKGEFHVYKDLELAKHAADEKVTEIYGAVRTDKGLIYVAKINDKRELELL